MSKKILEINHPVIKHKLSILRDKNTNSSSFRRGMQEIGRYLAYQVTKDLELEEVEIETPFVKTKAQKVSNPPVVISIMRSGNGLLDGVLEALPFARAGHIGIYRDKFIKNTVEYYFKVPDNAKGREVIVLDPLIATGDTIVAVVDRLKQYDVGKIKVLALLAAPEGLERLHYFHEDVEVCVVNIENGLNENGYLLPGLGDAGDRLYNTN